MFRINRLSDYALVLLARMSAERTSMSASALALESGVPAPTVKKLLKELGHAGFVVGTRGPQGGYALARSPEEISVAEVLRAIEGPLSPTVCTSGTEYCALQEHCPVTGAWQHLAYSLQELLEHTTLAQLLGPPLLPHAAHAAARLEVSP